MNEDQIEQVRRFNREVTRRIGVLTDNYLGRGRALAESRLLFEVGPNGAEVRELRVRLSLDSGYLSRLLRSLQAQGLLRVRRAVDDGRVRYATLTRKGMGEFDALNGRSETFAASLLAPLAEAQRQRLLAAMGEVQRFLRASEVTIEITDPDSPDARICIEAYLQELDERFETGFNPSLGPSADPEELVPPAGVLLIARLDGQPVGCGALKVMNFGVGEIKRMWVAPLVRGLGIAQRLLDMLEAQAAGFGLDTLRLDTNRSLVEARLLYLRNGYREIPPYNENPYADHWFEKNGISTIGAEFTRRPRSIR